MTQDEHRASEPRIADRGGDDTRPVERGTAEPAGTDAIHAELDRYSTDILNELRSLNDHLEARL